MRFPESWLVSAVAFSLVGNACLFSPEKDEKKFALSTRIWDGIEIDSAGQKANTRGWVRLHFKADGQAEAQVGHSKGQGPYAVRSSGRMQLGFEDEPLRFSRAEAKFNARVEAWLPGFLASVDRYLEQDGKLYLRAAAFPDVMATLGKGDTSVSIPTKPNPSTALRDSLLRALQSTRWHGVSLDSSGLEFSLENRLSMDFSKETGFRASLPCNEASGDYTLDSLGKMTFFFVTLTKKACSNSVGEATLRLALSQPKHRITLSKENLVLRPQNSPYTLVLTSKAPTPPDPGTPIDPELRPLLYLPADFPVHGGKAVPQERKALYDDLTQAWFHWQHAEISHYSYEFSETCLCDGNRNGLITVENGQVLSFVSQGKDGQPPPFSTLPTMERLFAQIGLLATQPFTPGETLSARFNSHGIPISFKADPIPSGVNDEVSFSVENFQEKADGTRLEGTSWILIGVQKSALFASMPGEAILNFDGNGYWSGDFACNQYAGNYAPLDDGSYRVTLGSRTYLECGESEPLDALLQLFRDAVYLRTTDASLQGFISSPNSEFVAHLSPLSGRSP